MGDAKRCEICSGVYTEDACPHCGEIESPPEVYTPPNDLAEDAEADSAEG